MSAMQKVQLGTATLYQGDCMDLMAKLPDDSVDMICCDMPYGTTACKWDTTLNLPDLWEHYKRIAKPGVAIVLFAAQPFAVSLIMSNPKIFKYEWIYEKTNPKGFLSAKRRPLTSHENILVFCDKTPPYNPQKWTIPDHLRTKRKHATSKTSGECYGSSDLKRWDDDGSRYPTSVIGFSNRAGRKENYHPTQKPLELIEYLINTYTNKGDAVLDNCMGSGTTGVAAVNTGREFVGVELDKDYFNAACKRIEKAISQQDMFAPAAVLSEKAQRGMFE